MPRVEHGLVATKATDVLANLVPVLAELDPVGVGAAFTASRLPIGADRTSPGSLGALIVACYGSTEFQRLAPITRATHRNICERLRAPHGDKPVAQLQREHVKRLMAGKAAAPATANAILKMLRIPMSYAVDMG